MPFFCEKELRHYKNFRSSRLSSFGLAILFNTIGNLHQRLPADAVRQHQFCRLPYILTFHFATAGKGGKGFCRFQHNNIAPMAINPHLNTGSGNLLQQLTSNLYLQQKLLCRGNFFGQFTGLLLPARDKALWILIKQHTPLHNLYPLLHMVPTRVNRAG